MTALGITSTVLSLPNFLTRSTRELEREKLAERLELSSREVTEHQEAEWRSLDSLNPTQGWPPQRQVKYDIDFSRDKVIKAKALFVGESSSEVPLPYSMLRRRLDGEQP